jgi:hypothetical protein
MGGVFYFLPNDALAQLTHFFAVFAPLTAFEEHAGILADADRIG